MEPETGSPPDIRSAHRTTHQVAPAAECRMEIEAAALLE